MKTDTAQAFHIMLHSGAFASVTRAAHNQSYFRIVQASDAGEPCYTPATDVGVFGDVAIEELRQMLNKWHEEA